MPDPAKRIEPGVQRVLQSKAETRAYYNKLSGVYDLLAEHSEGPVRRAGVGALGVQAGEQVLEIGYGTGHSLVELAHAVGSTGRVHGIDLSEGMQREAQKRMEDAHVADRISLHCGDMLQLPFASDSLDAVFMSFTLELLDTPEIVPALAECRRVLRPGGRISIVAITKDAGETILLEAYEWTHQHFPNLLDCRPIYVRRALEAAGFRVASSHIVNMWVPVEIAVGVA